MHIILFILKLIGIILVSLIGILFALTLIILLVPIKYTIHAVKKDNFFSEIKISWLFKVLFFKMVYVENHLVIKVRLLGFLIFDNNRVKKKRKKKRKIIRNKKSRKSKIIKRSNNDNIKRSSTKQNLHDLKKDKLSEDSLILPEDNEKMIVKLSEDKKVIVNSPDEDNNKALIDSPDEVNNKVIEDLSEDRTKVEGKLLQVNDQLIEDLEDFEGFSEESKKDLEDNTINREKEKANFFKKIAGKIKDFINSVKKLYFRIKNFIIHFKEKLESNITKIKHILEKIKYFYRDDINKAGFSVVLTSLKHFLKHIRPKKLLSNVKFGMGDPCLTGQALGVMATLFGFYGTSVEITPDFENVVFTGTIFCKGRIRIITLLIICIKLIRNKYFIRLLKNIKELKEEF